MTTLSDQSRRLDRPAYAGLQSGKDIYRICVVTASGRLTVDQWLPCRYPALTEFFQALQRHHGVVVAVVGNPADVADLPAAAARDAGCPIAYLPQQEPRSQPRSHTAAERDAAGLALTASATPDILRYPAATTRATDALEELLDYHQWLVGHIQQTTDRLNGLLPRHCTASQHRPVSALHNSTMLDQPAHLAESAPQPPTDAATYRSQPDLPHIGDDTLTTLSSRADTPETDADLWEIRSLLTMLNTATKEQQALARRIEQLATAAPTPLAVARALAHTATAVTGCPAMPPGAEGPVLNR
ncbi:IS110 family transposase [Streptomyces cucumeris]|uniref:IS110 family transposase n=1 Tax=Streptomyces cucumeris TaxID=2962890 RepID=UPI003D70D518